MSSFLKSIAVVLPTVLVLDYIWIGLLMKGFYDAEFGAIARRDATNAMSPRLPPAVLVYLLIPTSLVMFVGPRIGTETSLLQAFGWGAAFGFAMYGVYDLTNFAILERWSLRLTVVDMAWGTFLCGACAAMLKLCQRWIG
jgi:uncharacterized membrane protein